MLNKKLLFIQSTYGDAHQMIRYQELKAYYHESSLLAFERTYYDSTQDLTFISLGKVDHGKYVGRIKNYIKAVRTIEKQISDNLDTDIYFYGFDLLPFLAFRLKKRYSKLIFEIPDIRELYFKKNSVAKILLYALKLSMKKVSILVVTSELFITGFLEKNGISVNGATVIENKVHAKDIEYADVVIDNDNLTIGYFGLIRCARSLKILLKYLDTSENSKLVMYGYFHGISTELKEKVTSHAKVSYRGMYRSPRDLNMIYKNIDLTWIAYPYSAQKEGNFKYARTNRFYEAGYFGIPMLANIESGDAFYVDRYNCGLNIDLSNIKNAAETLRNITPEKINIWKKNLDKIDRNQFEASKEDYDELIAKLRS